MGNMISFLAAIQVPELNWIGQLVAGLYGLIGNYGWTVVVFTIILKIITLPLDFWQRSSSKKNQLKMQQMQPMLEKIDKAYGANRKGAQQEKQKLMKKFGYSMFSSCLPTLVTLVVFIFMFSGLTSYSSHANVKEYNALVESYRSNIIIEVENRDCFDVDESLIAVATSGNWTEETEQMYVVDFTNSFKSLSPEQQSEIIETVKPKVAEFAEENRESFLWIKNIWRPDTWASVMPSYDEFKNGALGIQGIDGAIKTEYEVIYEAVSEYAGGYAEAAWNGLLILPILSILLSIVSTKLAQKAQPSNDPQTQASTHMMSLMMPLVMSIFILMYTAALGVYIVANSILAIISTLVLTPIINKKYKDKEVNIVNKASYRR